MIITDECIYDTKLHLIFAKNYIVERFESIFIWNLFTHLHSEEDIFTSFQIEREIISMNIHLEM